jgi:protein-disulfide isomerase
MFYQCLRLNAFLVFSLLAFSLAAQTKECDKLRGARRETAHQVLTQQHPHDCCDGTILQCLAQKPVCKLATRLANDVCRRAAAGQSAQNIKAELTRRANSAFAPRVAVDIAPETLVGPADAPIEIVIYLCARCPYCAKLAPELYGSVCHGHLKGKVKLYVRPFPIRSHRYSTIAAKAMLAAGKLGKFWPFLLELYSTFDRFCPDQLSEYAAKVGLDPQRFQKLLDDPELEQALVNSKKEGIRNQVDATPTVFINQRRYSADLSLPAIEDFVEELLEAQ